MTTINDGVTAKATNTPQATEKPKTISTPKTVAAKLHAQQARTDLADTLDALEGKLNLPKNAAAAYRRNPLPFIIGGVVAVGAIVGVVIWAIARDD